jgi:hypothetical protein
MWLFNFKYGAHFLIISLVFIIIIYYIQRNTMKPSKENYEFQPYRSSSIVGSSRNNNAAKVTFTTGEPLPFCNDSISIDPPSAFAVGLNQSLAYGYDHIDANPKTKIKPVVVPPSHDLESWRDNNLITRSIINSPGIQQEMYLSGYAESTCCGYIDNGTELVPRPVERIPTVVGGTRPKQLVENYGSCGSRSRGGCPGSIVSPVPVDDTAYVPTVSVREGYSGSRCGGARNSKSCPGAIVSPVPVDDTAYVPTVKVREGYSSCGARNSSSCPGSIVSPVPVDDTAYVPTVPVVEGYRLETGRNDVLSVQDNNPGWVNTACGYNPDQVMNGLPSNLPVGNCDQSPEMRRYNENLFTQIVTPGVYSRNQVNEPINSNIGISFTQQFEPVTCKRDDKGLQFTLHDPRIIEPAFETPSESVKAKYDNVYDPRFYGYGTSYRSYLEPVTGQTRFMYDDVNAIRMPNYVTRSKIDHLPYADHYGAMEPGNEMGNELTANIRYLAQDSWLRDSLQFREDLEQRLMRKVNAEGWQKRMYPNSSRPIGSSFVQRH